MASIVTLAIMSLSPPSGLTQSMRRQNSFDREWRLPVPSNPPLPPDDPYSISAAMLSAI